MVIKHNWDPTFLRFQYKLRHGYTIYVMSSCFNPWLTSVSSWNFKANQILMIMKPSKILRSRKNASNFEIKLEEKSDLGTLKPERWTQQFRIKRTYTRKRGWGSMTVNHAREPERSDILILDKSCHVSFWLGVYCNVETLNWGINRVVI